MTNKEIIDRINSAYKMPTDEQILQVLKALHPRCFNNIKKVCLALVKEHYYD